MDRIGPVTALMPGRVVPLSPRRQMVEGIDGRSTAPTDTEVTRLLPQRRRRSVGAWCLVDHYGPDDVTGSLGMQVHPHPHTGLQTVSWLFDGEVRHRDTVGNDVLLRPEALGRPPGFELHRDVAAARFGDADVRVLLGRVGDAESAAMVHTPIMGDEVRLPTGGRAPVPLEVASTRWWSWKGCSGSAPTAPRSAGQHPSALRAGRTTVREDSRPDAGERPVRAGRPPASDLPTWWSLEQPQRRKIESGRCGPRESSTQGAPRCAKIRGRMQASAL